MVIVLLLRRERVCVVCPKSDMLAGLFLWWLMTQDITTELIDACISASTTYNILNTLSFIDTTRAISQ